MFVIDLSSVTFPAEMMDLDVGIIYRYLLE